LSSRYQHELSPGGLDVIRLRNDCLDLAVVPQAGGKAQDSGGWDEVLLSIKPSHIRTASEHIAAIPDHSAVVEMSYVLRNEGDEALPSYWCAHPPDDGSASVLLKDGSGLTFQFNPEELPWSLKLEMDKIELQK
jgi:hypothetical protein